MTLRTPIRLVLPLCLALAASARAQPILLDVMARHGVDLPGQSLEAGFDAGVEPTVPVQAGSLATPAGHAVGGDRRRPGRGRLCLWHSRRPIRASGAPMRNSPRPARPWCRCSASDDRRSRIAAARVAGRVLAASFEPRGVRPAVPAGLADGLFAMLNRPNESEQLAAMDALGLIRETNAVTALNERYAFYRSDGKRALAGGALEALARIGDASSVELIKGVAGGSLGRRPRCHGPGGRLCPGAAAQGRVDRPHPAGRG